MQQCDEDLQRATGVEQVWVSNGPEVPRCCPQVEKLDFGLKHWLFGGPSPSIGLSPSSTVELVPIFPHVCPPALPPPVGKGWIDKRIPNCKIFLNNSFALDSTWIYPEESRLFHGYEKPHLLANQVAVSLSRPAPASRPLPTVVLAPQPIPGGCHNSLKPVGSSPAIAIAAAAAAMVSVDAEGLGGPSPSSAQPCHFLTLAPIKIPLRTVSFPEKSRDRVRTPRPPALMLRAERKSPARDEGHKEPPPILMTGEDNAAKGSRPVASTPVPGSPWDLNYGVIAEHSDGSGSEDGLEDPNVKTKRNRTEGQVSPGPEEAEREDKGTRTPPPQILLPLEERVTHFRDMLLERGVSAFSTWEKELHKVVFDPRYLL
ncbi:PREDICTED: transcription elongation regulator 1-like protein, partial [Myotis davidii]|uniref:transcription elongation regulator 1-like protein n=1 Tax=Myotis davidii TaxID=225400 RepID=UPI0003EC533B